LQGSTTWNAAFVACSQVHWDALYRFAFSLTHDEAASEDFVQHTLLKALQGFERFAMVRVPEALSPSDVVLAMDAPDHEAHLKNWLYRILKNTFLDENVKRKRARLESTVANLSSLEEVPSETNEHVPYSFSSQSEISAVDLARFEKEFSSLALDDGWQERMETLTPRQRSVLFLSAESYSYKEIATLLGVPIGTVMSNLSRALQKLKRPKLGTFAE
jgi:RNA polymerase sigma factor (sigma-70 family)